MLHLLATLTTLLLLAAPAVARSPDFADGGGGVALPSYGQGAVIEYHDSTERLRLALTFPDEPGAGWVYAVPAARDNLDLSLEQSIGTLRGIWPGEALGESLVPPAAAVVGTQLWPLGCCLFFHPSLAQSAVLPAPLATLHRYGLRVDLLDPASPDDLAAQLAALPLRIDPAERRTLDSLIDHRHLFVAISIEDADAYKPFAGPGSDTFPFRSPTLLHCELLLTFPADCPTLPAAARWQTEVPGPRSIVAPAAFLPGALPQYAHVQSYIGAWHNISDGRGYQIGDAFPYTRYYSDNQSHEEVRFDRPAPLHITAAWTSRQLLRHDALSWTLTLLVILALSYLSGGLAGLVVIRRWREGARLGLWNLLTLIVVAIRAANHPATLHRAGAFTLAFSAIYVSLCMLLYSVFLAFLGGNPLA